MKKLLILIGLTGLSFTAAAQVQGNTVRIDSLASQFAMQAGTIAGVVQACGQTVTEYNARVIIAVKTLAQTPQEQLQAMVDYQKTLSDSRQAEERTHSIKCDEAIKSFNSLPLMQPDYEKTVLPQLRKMAAPQSYEARAAETVATPAGNPVPTSTATPTATPAPTPTATSRATIAVTPPAPGSQ